MLGKGLVGWHFRIQIILLFNVYVDVIFVSIKRSLFLLDEKNIIMLVCLGARWRLPEMMFLWW